MSGARLLDTDRALLLELLGIPTAGPLETGPDDPPARLWEAQHAFLDAASDLGLVPVHHAAAKPEELRRDDVPVSVRRAVDATPGFLDSQPSLVLRLGPPLPRGATVMFNVHLDTVAGLEPVGFDGARFYGRGAIDAKGPAVALLAGIRAALRVEPAVIGTDVGVLIQAVAGEEGGAMGTLGTRPLVERGFVGRLNVFCEPTGLRYLPRATAAATARVRVDGRDAIDDRPDQGHNASVLLGFLAQHLGLALAPCLTEGRVCVAGLRTGGLHNRVYGTGELLVNLSYSSSAAGRRLESAFAAALSEGLEEFSRRFARSREFALTAAEAASVTRLEWLKRGLPTLACADPWAETLLERDAGLARWPDDEPALTCDAIWMDRAPEAFTIVCGPGDLAANNAHAAGEYADQADLERFAAVVARILVGFARRQSAGREDRHDPGETRISTPTGPGRP
ncbi:MAG: M20/M25/M40 family metallo-hydrolase [Actinomycetota bacterium]|nr:M20/M25/M40 family metallo-hydrolase [Actinomycetota bacterium]